MYKISKYFEKGHMHETTITCTSPNVINLSKRNLTKNDISLLSKGLQFVPTPKHFNKALLREELENFGRKLRLKWFFYNYEHQFNINPFKQKSKFNPCKNDAAI